MIAEIIFAAFADQADGSGWKLVLAWRSPPDRSGAVAFYA